MAKSKSELEARLERLEKENAVLRKIVNTVRSDPSDVDLISYIGGNCLLFPCDGAWKIKLAGETEWAPAADIDDILSKLTKED